MTFKWTPGHSGGENLQQWFVVDIREYMDNQHGHWKGETEVRDNTTQYKLTGLNEDTTYDIRVFSENEFGRNINGQIVTATTGCK